jgi:ribosomal protein L24
MAISKIQTGDRVKVITGKYKNTIGTVTEKKSKVLRNGKSVTRIAVSTIEKIIKYRKAANFQGESYPGEKLTVNRTIDISNVQLVTPDNIASRSKVQTKDGKKVRIYTKNSSAVLKEKNELIEKKVN